MVIAGSSCEQSAVSEGGNLHSMLNVPASDGCAELANQGFTWVIGQLATPEEAWQCASEFIGTDDAIDAPIEVIGNSVIPPLDGSPSRDFQTLHFDFGVPLDPVAKADVARWTALQVPASASSVHPVTRFVPLRPLLGGHPWPDHNELVRRFVAYGESHGTWQAGTGYAEGSLARIIEAALGQKPVLPSVRADPDFLCGTEFSTMADEMLFFAQRGLLVDAVVMEVCLQPGELLLFDNLSLAHGRRGVRAPGELHQRVYGHRALHPGQQIKLRDSVLGAFTS
jgi:hypothetical protein